MSNCCIECFKDEALRDFLQRPSNIGNCDFCGSLDVELFDLTAVEHSGLWLEISSLINLYEVSSEGNSNGKLIKHALHEDWVVFNINPDAIQKLIENESIIEFIDDKEVLSKPVIIPQLYNHDYLNGNCIVREKNWTEFTEIIKYQNRFHSGVFNYKAFAAFISYSIKLYNKDDVMYRARISSSAEVYGKNNMGVPPKEKRMAGRVNPDGIGVLYLASEPNTALSEVRASAFDFVTIGKFVAKQQVKLVDLSGLLTVSPFLYESDKALLNHAINLGVLKDIVSDIAKPMRRSDSTLEYLPTQYIAELIKSEGYDGVEYQSTIAKSGINLAIFNEESFECVDTWLIEVEKLEYTSKKYELLNS